MPEIRKKFNLEVMTTFFENFRQNPQILKSQISVSNFKSRVMVLVSNFLWIAFFYCRLVVHVTDGITDTRAPKVVSYTSARITETVFAHDQHWEEQNTLSSPQLYRHSQEHKIWISIQ